MTAVLEQYQPRTGEIMPMTDPTGGRLVAWAGAGRAAWQIAEAIADTDFIPRHFKGKPGDIMAALMLSDELGLPPVSGLRSIYVISGTPALYARTMVALAMQHGHEVWTEVSTDAAVTVCGQRRGSKHVERATWDTARARKAGYTSNKKYESDPQAMLYAKAAAEVARKVAPDVLNGVPYSVEDLELEQPEATATVTRAPVARTGPRTVQRQQAKPVAPEPEFDEPTPEPVKATAERAPAAITPKQLTALNAALSTDLGLTDREDKLAYLSGELGREIGSSKEVTKDEATRLIDKLAAEREGDPGAAEPTLDEWPPVAAPNQDGDQ